MLAACRTHEPAPAIDPALSARVPVNATALAYIDLDRLRASPLTAHLSANLATVLDPLSKAHQVLIAARGSEIVGIVRGEAPGAKPVGPGIALLGASSLIAESASTHQPAAILTLAEPLARGHAIWMVLHGGTPLSLTGNLANLNTLLRDTESAGITVDLGDPSVVQLTANCTSADAAGHFEQALRALVSLSSAATRRQPELAAVWSSVRLSREDRVVRATAAVPISVVERLAR